MAAWEGRFGYNLQGRNRNLSRCYSFSGRSSGPPAPVLSGAIFIKKAAKTSCAGRILRQPSSGSPTTSALALLAVSRG